MELAEIQQAIEQLPKDQQAALAAWLAERGQTLAHGNAGVLASVKQIARCGDKACCPKVA